MSDDHSTGDLSAAELHAQWDAITIDELHARGGMKWSANPGMIGAWVAESDLGTAPAVTRALRAAVDRGELGYLPRPLAAELREATSAWMRERHGWEVAPARIHPIADVITGLDLAIDMFSRPGSAVIVPTPAYMPFLSVPQRHGRAVIEVPNVTDARCRSTLDLTAIDAHLAAGAGLVVLCNPLNPVGRVFDREELDALAEVVARHGARVFADEVHAPVLLGHAEHVPFATLSDTAAEHTITATSASKAFNLPGLKTAQLITSNTADQQSVIDAGPLLGHGTSTLGVVANTAAFQEGGPWLDAFVDYLRGNARLLGERLAARVPELVYREPEGTYIAWLDLRAVALPDGQDASAIDLGQWLQTHAGVALTDGRACGVAGAGHVRMILATPRPIVEEIADRIATALGR